MIIFIILHFLIDGNQIRYWTIGDGRSAESGKMEFFLKIAADRSDCFRSCLENSKTVCNNAEVNGATIDRYNNKCYCERKMLVVDVSVHQYESCLFRKDVFPPYYGGELLLLIYSSRI